MNKTLASALVCGAIAFTGTFALSVSGALAVQQGPDIGGGGFAGVDVADAPSLGGGDSSMAERNAPHSCTRREALDIAASYGIKWRSFDGYARDQAVVHGRLKGKPVEMRLGATSDDCAVQRLSYL